MDRTTPQTVANVFESLRGSGLSHEQHALLLEFFGTYRAYQASNGLLTEKLLTMGRELDTLKEEKKNLLIMVAGGLHREKQLLERLERLEQNRLCNEEQSSEGIRREE